MPHTLTRGATIGRAPAHVAQTGLDSPLGTLTCAVSAHGLALLAFDHDPLPAVPVQPRHPWLAGLAEQLHRYWLGQAVGFDLPLDLHGTAFQREVWHALCRIPHGRTCSYGELAAGIGRPRAMRAVGLANRANPVAIVVPCHRVIGRDGSLTGYAGGLARKQALLALESAQRPLACSALKAQA